MLNVYLLRHGQTSWNADGNRYCGRTDLPLTDLGVQQAKAVQVQLASVSFNAIYSSPLQRAYRTAQIASGVMEVITDERLTEADFGNWEGKTRQQFIEEDPELWNAWSGDPSITKAGGTGETAREIIERVDAFFISLLHNNVSGNILVVAHNGVNRFYLAYKLGMNLRDYRKLVQENSTITLFQLDDQGELTLYHLNSKM